MSKPKKPRKKKYEVAYCTAVMTWEVEAASKKEAISKCSLPKYADPTDGPGCWLANEIKEDEG